MRKSAAAQTPIPMRVEKSCQCCPGCDHDLAADPIDDRPLEGQYKPCNVCGQSISGKPTDGKTPLRLQPGTVEAPLG